MPLDADQLHCCEPIETAGEPRDLAVVPDADHGLKVPANGELTQTEALELVVEAVLEWLVREVIGNP